MNIHIASPQPSFWNQTMTTLKSSSSIKHIGLLALLCACLLVAANAHDMFLKFDSYFLNPNSRATVRLINGTFRTSENAVTRDRMADVSLVKPAGERTHPPLTDWRDLGNTALLTLQTGEAGTYVAGLYTKPRELTMNAAAFNRYLAQEGLPDTLAARKRDGELTRESRERYSKHVKAVFQVGETHTDTYKTVLGYPVEIIPQQNPYELKTGQTLEVLCVKGGQPIVGQYVLAGREFKGKEVAARGVRTDQQGVARIVLKGPGRWYVKFIHMSPVKDAPINYESKWATLTFELR
ncbi:MAG: DUF4198 domain-containing protein [Acidobacteria bacterium]|nr:DUF4198 domain-containing protein [Acidobacteriota bacterium]